ncbi:MAG TPA: GH116 family glycosyl hydrolase [Blastocatellia bacterium]|nr:GH116 family glycosyl hydrolase [Blastocatellia bacterium]
MKRSIFSPRAVVLLLLSALMLMSELNAQSPPSLPPKFSLPPSGLELERRTQAGSFFDVVGRRAAAFGYENRAMEAWVYPLKLVDDFQLSFKLEGYPLAFEGRDIQARINVRPEATTFTCSHAAFTVRETIFAPVDEPGLVILLDVQTVLPLQIIGSFRPALKLMWPAGLMTGNVDYAKRENAYYLVEESNRYVGVIGSPAAKDISVMPYQEEPRDVPTRFVIDVPVETLRTSFIPIVMAGSIEGRARAREIYQRLLGHVQQLYENNVAYYKKLESETLSVATPDDRLNKAFAWAKVGVDKGLATSPHLGTGLIAGFRTSGNSERPGFAWFFGRDALWSSFAINSYGDFAATRTALEFLKKVQRADGKIPHEISQAAGLINWFSDYVYPWASADATPLYIIGHADYLRWSGDREFIKASWDSIVKAYRFAASTDTDGNGLIENTRFGHGWVEGGRLYPPHEEIYQQGVWVEALRSIAEMSEAINADAQLAAEARSRAETVQKKIEETYWIEAQKFYAFATNLPRSEESDDERDEKNPAVKTRMKELRESRLMDEVTVLPAVPMWWRVLDDRRADQMLDRIGSAEISADWGARILSDQSRIYDPLSYHYGSVWPLFTGWASMAAYKYHRAHIGYDYLMANALLTYDNALGYVTELLSGEFNQAFGRSSHHQVWSCAMVVTPLVRGMLGLEADAVHHRLTFAPQLPADWQNVSVKNYRMGQSSFDLTLERFTPVTRAAKAAPPGTQLTKLTISRTGTASEPATELLFAPAFAADAEIRRVSVNGKDAKFDVINTASIRLCQIRLNVSRTETVEIEYLPGTEVFFDRPAAKVGDTSRGLKLISTATDANEFRINLEGLSEATYEVRVRSHRPLSRAVNAEMSPAGDGTMRLRVVMPRAERGGYVRQTIRVEFGEPSKR